MDSFLWSISSLFLHPTSAWSYILNCFSTSPFSTRVCSLTISINRARELSFSYNFLSRVPPLLFKPIIRNICVLSLLKLDILGESDWKELPCMRLVSPKATRFLLLDSPPMNWDFKREISLGWSIWDVSPVVSCMMLESFISIRLESSGKRRLD